MSTNDVLSKLKAEIESRMEDCDANSKNPNQLLWAELAALIPFIDSLQQEPKWKPLPESLEALLYAIEGKWDAIKPTSYLSRRLEDLYEGLVNTFNVDESLLAELPKVASRVYTAEDIEELRALKDKIEASMEQEHPSEELDEAARLYAIPHYMKDIDVNHIEEYPYDSGLEAAFIAGAGWQKGQDDIIGKAMSYFGAESLLDNANGLSDFEKFTAWLYCEFLRGLPKKLNQDYIKEQSKVILAAIKKELGKMPDSTELIAQWDAEREMLEQKDFRGDEWRLAQNAFFDGFGSGCLVQKEQMLKDAVEGYVNYYEDSGGILMAEAQVGCPYHNGDKVKIIVIKEDKE